jgi:putative peptidoglycan lipid II flippase
VTPVDQGIPAADIVGGTPPAEDAAAAARARRAIGGGALIVAAATLCSKLLGFLRDTVMADRFGSDYRTTAYIVASQLPLVLFAAVGVAIQMVFIPIFSSLVARREDAAAEHFAANVNGAVTLVVAVLIGLLEAFAGPIVSPFLHQVSAHFTAADRLREFHLAVRLLRIMSPLIMFYAWSGVAGGVLNSRAVFGPNAAMGIPQNLTIIASILLGTVRGARDMVLVGWGSLVGTLTTFLVQWPVLVATRFRLRWTLDLRDPLLRRMGRLVLPVVFTSLAQQSGIVVDRWLAARRLHAVSLLTDLTYAGRLQALAYAVLGLSVATVLYPALAAAVGRDEHTRFRQVLRRGLGLINFLTVPVMVGLFLLRDQTVLVVLRHGRFTAADAQATSFALLFFTLGTLSFAWQDYFNRAFFATHDTRTPMLGGFIAVAVNIGMDFLLVGPLRQGGLALGTALGWSAAALFLSLRLRARFGLLGGRRLAASALRMFVAAVAAFLPGRLLFATLWGVIGHGGLGAAATLFAVGGGGAVLYVGLCALLRVPEVTAARELLQAVLRRSAAGATP